MFHQDAYDHDADSHGFCPRGPQPQFSWLEMPPRPRRPQTPAPVVLVTPIVVLVTRIAVLVLALSGCREAADTPPGPSAVTGDVDAVTVLRDVIEHYQSASHYRDQGRLRLEYETNGQSTVEETQITVDFARPNYWQLTISRGINRLTMISDGNQLWTSVVDPVTDDLRHQVVQRAASRRPTIAEIYAATEMINPANPNQMLSVLMGLPLNLHTSQMGLLLHESAFLELLNRSQTVEFLAPEAIDDSLCDRIAVAEAMGNYVFWIDRGKKQVRRIEYPTRELFQLVSAEEQPQHVQLVLDLQEVSFERIPTSSFTFEIGTPMKIVQYFVLPPSPLPTKRFGQEIPVMTFTDCDGQRETNQDWDGRIQVLMWFDHHPESQLNVTKLDTVYREFAERQDRVVFRAICVEPTAKISADGVKQLAEKWQTTIPLTRDLDAAGRDTLDITDAPTVVVLDGQRRLQMFEVGANPQIDQSAQIVLQRLLSGQDVAADVLRNWQVTEDRFRQQLQLASVNHKVELSTDAPALAPAADFQKLKATLAWQTDQVVAPGNLLSLSSSPSTVARLIALDGMQEVVELDHDGAIVSRRKLDLEEGAFVGQLRHAADRQGAEYYLGFSQLGRHVYLFDQQFRRVVQYPPDDQRHNGIMAAELLDLDQDGELEIYVGFAEPNGCHRVDLSGRRVWSNRRLPATVSLAPRTLAGPAHLLATGEPGWILPISSSGQEGEPITVGQRTIHQLAASTSTTARPAHFLGMSYSMEGRLIAVGLDGLLQEQWSYGLPSGVYRQQVCSPVWATLWSPDVGCWLLAGPDGSVHVVRDDGRFFDYVNTGSDIFGLIGAVHENEGRLYVATPGKITAYDVTQPD